MAETTAQTTTETRPDRLTGDRDRQRKKKRQTQSQRRKKSRRDSGTDRVKKTATVNTTETKTATAKDIETATEIDTGAHTIQDTLCTSRHTCDEDLLFWGEGMATMQQLLALERMALLNIRAHSIVLRSI